VDAIKEAKQKIFEEALEKASDDGVKTSWQLARGLSPTFRSFPFLF
jgi:hypothetical protein